jgi:glycosyltransferase involved in cell wall biosynthesis
MRILHVASSFPHDTNDPTAPFMQEMLAAQALRGQEVSIIVPREDSLVEGLRSGVRIIGTPYAPHRRAQVWGYGKSFNHKGGLRPLAVFMTPMAMASLASALRREIRRQDPDVVHLHWVLPQGALSSVIPNSVPVVVSVHGADVRFSRGLMKPFTRKILARADGVIAASSGIINVMTSTLPSSRFRSYVIPHGADDMLFGGKDTPSARHSLGLDRDERIILAVGRLVPKKGFHNLIDAVASMQEVNVRLYIVGDGPARSRLHQQIVDRGADRIRLLGPLTREELATWYQAAEVVAIPSIVTPGDIDSGPVVLMEALAAGKAVVASRVGMALDVITHNLNGLLLDSVTPGELSEALQMALDQSDRLGSEGRALFERVGSWDRVAADLENVYEAAIAHRRATHGSSH